MTDSARPLTVLEFDHVVLRVRDQEVSRRFYMETLGLSLDHVNEAFHLVQLRAGRQLLDLLPLGEGGDRLPPAGRMDHLCLSIATEDLEAVVGWLRERGVRIDGDIASRRGAFGQGPSVYIQDPDGYRIELKPRPGPHS